MKISRKAHSKLNLFLHVTGKRKPLHELHSLVVFLDLADEITAEPATKIEVRELGSNSHIKNNIIALTAKKLAKKYSIKDGAKISFSKNIPVSAGLGGGSADAAATIILLNDLWNLKLSHQDMYKFGQEIGADVPVCLYSILENKNAALFSGIGEIIAAAPEMPKLHFVLVNPGKELATEKVFKAFHYKSSDHVPFAAKGNLLENLKKTSNDLEPAAKKLVPEIGLIIKELTAIKTCQLARMSGSGATCFGIFKNKRQAQQAAAELSAKYPEWKIIPAGLKPTGDALATLADKLDRYNAKTLRTRSFILSLLLHLLFICLYQTLFTIQPVAKPPRYIEISLSADAVAKDFPPAPTASQENLPEKSQPPLANAADQSMADKTLAAANSHAGSQYDKSQKPDATEVVDYLELLQYTVQEMSRIPQNMANLRGLAVLRLEFNREGYVTAYALKKRTGSKTLDAAAISIAKKLMQEPFPPAPPGFDRGEKILKYDFIIRYPPRKTI